MAGKPTETVKAQTKVGRAGGLSCIGNVCVDADGTIRIDLAKSECPLELVEALVRSTLQGREVVFDLKEKKKESP